MIAQIVIERDRLRGAVAQANPTLEPEGNPVKKATLGLVLAMTLAVLPVSLFATSAAAATDSTVRVINGNLASTTSADVYLDGVKVSDNLPIGTGVDITVAAGTPLLNACTAGSTGVAGDGTCAGGTNIGTKNQALTIGANSNYTLAIINAAQPAFLFPANSLSQTGLGEFNYTIHYAVPAGFAPPALDVCIGGVKVVTGLTGGSTVPVPNLTAQQGAAYAIFPSASGCASPNANVDFVAGTHFVQTIAGTQNPTCAAGCVQVLLVGEGTVPNNPNTVAFCGTILNGPASLSGFGPALKALVGNIDPTTTQTIIDTQPSVGAQKAFVDTYTAVLQAGDASVPAAIKDSWVTLTAGIRKLLQTFQLVGYDLSKLPTTVVKDIVLGANGIKLPGVPPDPDVVAATADLTAFVTGTCLASAGGTPTATPTAATPVAAAARFTG